MACQAYRQAPSSELSFTREDLNQGGIVLSPISIGDKKLDPGPADRLAYDLILANVLRSKWPKVTLLASQEISEILGSEAIDTWRSQLTEEEAESPSAASLSVLRKLTNQGKSYPKQILIPSLLQNSVSCGQRDPLSTALNPNPHGLRHYCQRLVKMRFRILSASHGEILWNGLIYATQENTLDRKDGENIAEGELEAPSTQSLIREAFLNFAKQFSERR